MEEYTGGVDASSLGTWALSATGYVLLLGKMAWDKFFSSEGKATEELVRQLSERITSQENKLMQLEREVDMERRLRRLEQNKVHTLVLYIIELKSELRKHGIEVPAHGALLHEDGELASLLGVKEDEDEQISSSPESP